MQLGQSFKTALQHLPFVKSNEPNAAPVIETGLIVAEDRDAWVKQARRQILSQQGQYFQQQTARVMQQAKIPVSQFGKLTIGPRYMSVLVRLADATQLKKAISLADAVGYAAKLGNGSAEPPVLAVPIAGWLHYQFQLPRKVMVHGQEITLWQDVFVNDKRLGVGGIGVGADNKPVKFTWEDAPHALIAATTDGGKSTLVTTILYTLMQQYTPEQIRIGIVDPKRDYNAFANVPHLVAPIANRAQDITNLLKYFAWEVQQRVDEGYEGKPRLILVIDEADTPQVLGTPINEKYALLVGNEGRGEQVNLIVSTHKPDADSIGAVRDTTDNRYLGKVTNSATSGQLGAGLGLHKLSSRGDFLHVARGHQHRFLGAKVPHRFLENLLRGEVPAIPIEALEWQLPGHVEPRGPGRPTASLEPQLIGRYLFYGDRLTALKAKRLWQVSDTYHQRYVEYAGEILKEYQLLTESGADL